MKINDSLSIGIHSSSHWPLLARWPLSRGRFLREEWSPEWPNHKWETSLRLAAAARRRPRCVPTLPNSNRPARSTIRWRRRCLRSRPAACRTAQRERDLSRSSAGRLEGWVDGGLGGLDAALACCLPIDSLDFAARCPLGQLSSSCGTLGRSRTPTRSALGGGSWWVGTR